MSEVASTPDQLTRAELAANNVKLVKALHAAEHRATATEAELKDYKDGADEEARAGDEARAELANFKRVLMDAPDVQDTEIERLQTLVEAQAAEVERLQGMVARLNAELAWLHQVVTIREQAITSLTDSDAEVFAAVDKAAERCAGTG